MYSIEFFARSLDKLVFNALNASNVYGLEPAYHLDLVYSRI